MNIVLGRRTAETAALYFEKTNNDAIRKTLPQKARTAEEAVADFHGLPASRRVQLRAHHPGGRAVCGRYLVLRNQPGQYAQRHGELLCI